MAQEKLGQLQQGKNRINQEIENDLKNNFEINSRIWRGKIDSLEMELRRTKMASYDLKMLLQKLNSLRDCLGADKKPTNFIPLGSVSMPACSNLRLDPIAPEPSNNQKEISNLSDLHISEENVAFESLLIKDISNSSISLVGVIGVAYLQNIKNCKILIGAVKSSCLIYGCSSSELEICSNQVAGN